MKNKFFLALLATTTFAANAWADDVNCYDYCTTAGNSCPTSGTGCLMHNIIASSEHVYYTLDGESGHMTIYGPSTGSSASIPGNAFANTSQNKSTLPAGVTSVSLSGNITSVGGYSFWAAQNLTNVNLTGAQTIGDRAFYNAHIDSIDITEVQTLTGYTFMGIKDLKSIVLPYSMFDGDTIKSTVDQYAFIGSGIQTFYVPENKSCGSVYGNTYSTISESNIIRYTQDSETGVYTVGDKIYATALDLTHRACTGTGNERTCTNDPIECTAGLKDCQIRALTYQGDKCSTQTECSNLIDMVSDSNYDCNSITTCSAYVKANNLNLASILSGGTGGAGSGTGSHGKRIYTVEEARAAVEAAGTDTVSFRIRYK